jgi:hypothetical protein
MMPGFLQLMPDLIEVAPWLTMNVSAQLPVSEHFFRQPIHGLFGGCVGFYQNSSLTSFMSECFWASFHP